MIANRSVRGRVRPLAVSFWSKANRRNWGVQRVEPFGKINEVVGDCL